MSSQFSIVGLGEILWDLLPAGAQLGGAPANFACHAQGLGASASIVSCVGADNYGSNARRILRDRGIDISAISTTEEAPTGTVKVTLDPAGVPTFEIIQNVAWDRLPWSEQLGDLAARTDAVCFGSLGQRSPLSRETIQKFVATTRPEAWRIFDINIRPPFCSPEVTLSSLELANALKLNDNEVPKIAEWCGLTGSPEEILIQLAERYALRAVALTLGADGAWLWRDGTAHHSPGVATTIADTVGAGDSFTAAWSLGLLRGEQLETIGDRACRIAAYVCSQPGGTPPLPRELLDHCRP